MLNDAEILAGIDITTAKSDQLLQDGQLLSNQGSYSSAGGLAVAALEEVGKGFLLGAMLSIRGNDKGAWKSFWRAFRAHEVKRFCAGWVSAGFPDIRRLSGQVIAVDVGQLDVIRLSALYVDRYEGQWIAGILSAQEAAAILSSALLTWNRFSAYVGAGAFERFAQTPESDRYSQEPFVRDLLGRIGNIANRKYDTPPSPEDLAKLIRKRRLSLVRWLRP